MTAHKTYFDHEKLKAYQEALRFFAWCEPVLDRTHTGKEILRGIVSMLAGLIQYHQPDRLREDLPEYRIKTQEQEQEHE